MDEPTRVDAKGSVSKNKMEEVAKAKLGIKLAKITKYLIKWINWLIFKVTDAKRIGPKPMEHSQIVSTK